MNILHLSDLHFGINNPKYRNNEKYDNKGKILDELIDCVKNIGTQKPEHIIVTGDIAWFGKKSEFQEASVWFKKLLKALDLRGKDLTFCVGNHDINRNYANFDPKIIEELTEKKKLGNENNTNNDFVDKIDEIYNYENIHKMESAIFEYDKFCEQLEVEPFKYPNEKIRKYNHSNIEYSYSIGYKDIKSSNDEKIRIFAFNTALLSFMPNNIISDDQMWIGQSQIKALMEYGIMPNDEINYSIALFHHAERFLHPNEICEYNDRVATLTLLRKNVDLVLCGHTETGGKPVLQKQEDGGELLTAGATYYSDNHPNVFSLVTITNENKKVQVTPFKYDLKEQKWIKYPLVPKMNRMKNLKSIPYSIQISEALTLFLKYNDKTFSIPIKSSNFIVDQNNLTKNSTLDNSIQVTRLLTVKCGGYDSKNTIRLAPKMEQNAKAILMQSEYTNFICEAIKNKQCINLTIENNNGTNIFSSKKSQNNNMKEIPLENINFLKKLIRIEEYYGCKFRVPDTIKDERSLECVNILIDLLDTGYTEGLKIKDISYKTSEKYKLEEFYNNSKKLNEIHLIYKTKFYCKLYNTEFCLDEISIISAKYHINQQDLENKINTFQKGDIREMLISPNADYKTLFILDEKKAKNKIDEIIGESFAVEQTEKLSLHWKYIYEK